MTRFDDKMYKLLKYFANNKLALIDKIREEDSKKYKKFVDEDIESLAFERGYIDADKENKYGITEKGLDQIRLIEGLTVSKRSWMISVIAVILTVITFIVSVIIDNWDNIKKIFGWN